jgi:hypothetical protein
MFDQTHYVPVLKGRDGEYGALKQLNDAARSKLTPLIEIPPVPWDFEKKIPQKSLDSHLEKVAAKLLKSWGKEHPIFLDTLWLAGPAKMKNGLHPLTYILQAGRTLDLKIVPVTGFMRERGHVDICKSAHRDDKRGVCLRLLREDLMSNDGPGSDLQRLLDELSASPREVDLLLDLRSLATGQATETAETIKLIRRIPELRRWRSFTICGTSFPSTLANLPMEACSYIARLEWGLWNGLREQLPEETRQPTFGDYAIAHPEPSEVDPRIMKASAAIRYTSSNNWLVVRGRGLKKYKFDQFYALSRNLTRRPEYRGKDFSWGDGYIEGCGRQVFGKGNLTTWRQVGTSHHLAFVLDQIASLSAS